MDPAYIPKTTGLPNKGYIYTGTGREQGNYYLGSRGHIGLKFLVTPKASPFLEASLRTHVGTCEEGGSPRTAPCSAGSMLFGRTP